jgi:hypothetical protein
MNQHIAKYKHSLDFANSGDFLLSPTVEEEIRRYSFQYSARLSAHPNDLVVNLMEQPYNKRLQRHLPNDLA